jgi:hypothetical protein
LSGAIGCLLGEGKYIPYPADKGGTGEPKIPL